MVDCSPASAGGAAVGALVNDGTFFGACDAICACVTREIKMHP